MASMIDFGTLKLIAYAGVIIGLNATGGVGYHGVNVRPCTEMTCYRPPPPPLGSYWTYHNGKYQAAYNGKVWVGQKQLAGFWH